MNMRAPRNMLDVVIDAIMRGETPSVVWPNVKPPPPDPPGCPPERWGKGRRHGYVSTYNAGCRCPLCTAARRDAARRSNQRNAERSDR